MSMALKFDGELTQTWDLGDSDSETSASNTRATTSNLEIGSGSRHTYKDTDKKPLQDSRKPLEPAAAKAQKPPSSYHIRWENWSSLEIWSSFGVIAVALSVIVVSSGSRSSPQSALLSPRNILQLRNTTIAKFDLGAVGLACQNLPVPICDQLHLFRKLDLQDSQNHQDIESLGSHLGALLHPTKMAKNKEECSYFPQLQLDINQACHRSFEIQDSLNASLVLSEEIQSWISQSRLTAEEMVSSADEGANGRLISMEDPVKREKNYTDGRKWLDLLGDFTQKLESRDAFSKGESKRQKRLQEDLKAVDNQIVRLGIEQSAEGEIHASSQCSAFNMEQVERRLINSMTQAAEDDAAAQSLRNCYDAL